MANREPAFIRACALSVSGVSQWLLPLWAWIQSKFEFFRVVILDRDGHQEVIDLVRL
jgi:hypothetical protein